MAEEIVVRDECACGRRYRVKNPTAGFKFRCPSCQREIEITQADILLAEPVEPLATKFDPPSVGAVPQTAGGLDEPLDVIPLEDADLRVADHGSSIGALGKVGYSSADAQLRAALSPRSLLNSTEEAEVKAYKTVPEEEKVQHSFVGDLFMSFALAGSRDNAIKLLAMAAGVSFCFMLGMLLVEFQPGNIFWRIAIRIALMVPGFFAFVYIMQFYWEVLGTAANGEDELGWEQTSWDFWGDVIKPYLWLLFITLFCALPALFFLWLSPLPFPDRAYVSGLILVAGLFFWPVAVMWVAIGESLFYLRPDLMVRTVAVVGPSYLLVWVILLLALGLWVLSFSINWSFGVPGPAGILLRIIAPLLSFGVDIYIGYVVFRTIGLIFRYHREKLPLGF